VLGAGFWVLASGYWFLGTGFWVLVSGCWFLGTGFWLMASGCWLLVDGFWVLVTGCWLLVDGFWVLVTGFGACSGWVSHWVVGSKENDHVFRHGFTSGDASVHITFDHELQVFGDLEVGEKAKH
jgi:hypothetical protein